MQSRSQPQRRLTFTTDAGIAERARIGLLVLATDHTIEHDFRVLLDVDGVGLFQSRLAMDNIVTPDSLQAMESRIASAADLLLPDTHLDVSAYGCTSASMIIGEQGVFRQIHSVRPNVVCTTPVTAAFAAFAALEMRRVAVLTPYTKDVNDQIRQYMEQRGVNVTAFGSFFEPDDRQVAKISERSIIEAALALGNEPGVDGVFISCTSLRLAHTVERIEQKLGKPVTGSNHAMAWHCLRLAGVNDTRPEHGQLFQKPLT